MDLVTVAKNIGTLQVATALNNIRAIDGSCIYIYHNSDNALINLLKISNINVMNEKQLEPYVSYSKVHQLLRHELRFRSGWYFQQFLQVAAALFISKDEDITLTGSDFFIMPTFKFKTENGKIFLSTLPHVRRNWDYTLERLGAFNHVRRLSFVAEHVVTKRRILEFIVRRYSPSFNTLEFAFDNFVSQVLIAVNECFEIVASDDNDAKSDPALRFDLFSEYQFISLMMLNNFGDEVQVRNISHARFFSLTRAIVDRKIGLNYDALVFEVG